MKFGLCCISLDLKEQGYSFNKITYKKFNSLPRREALCILGKRIINNLLVTEKSINYCKEKNLCYRVSSDLFPLITYDKAEVNLEDLPNYQEIESAFDSLKNTINLTKVRISAHPSEFNVLASENATAVNKTIKELNFYSKFFDRIGCDPSHLNPMNLHINNKCGSDDEVINRFLNNFEKLDDNCKSRLVIENDDKVGCWSVKQLIKFNKITKIPLTFDYLHHKCHPDGFSEKEAIGICFNTWDAKPLFHYSESREGNNPRAHSDYPNSSFDCYGFDFDIDFEFKMKDKAIDHYRTNLTNKL